MEHEKPQWFKDHEKYEEERMKLLVTKSELKPLVHEALTEYFEDKGSMTKKVLIGTAVVIGSITVIFGGIKAILGWLGFSYISKP